MASDSIYNRLVLALDWRRKEYAKRFSGFLARCGGRVFVGVRWPWPVRKPYQRKRLRLAAPGGGIGDELMCTPIFAEIKKRNPNCHITFISRYPDFFKSHPDIDEVELFQKGRNQKALQLSYAHAVPPLRPIMTLMAECAGLNLDFDQLVPPPSRIIPELEDKFNRISGPRVVIQPLASHWTPNKNWPVENWRQLVKMLAEHFTVIEVGTKGCFPGEDFGPRFYSFAGQTELDALSYIISRADVFVGPVSGGMHLANAHKIRSVIIFGGYESPEGFRFPRTEAFYSAVECAPCWLPTACPYGLKCMKMIEPKSVYEAVCRAIIDAPRSV